MKLQPVESQRGEIEFRKKVVQQQVEGLTTLEHEYDAKGIEQILHERMKKTLEQITALRNRGGIPLSPYLEIGAERCQRSLVMENDLGATGSAADISYDMLKSCAHYGRVFNKNKMPLRVCCDANTLPYASDSIPFVFCYETLHHFPDPAPILKEIHRVLSPGGVFFFDEEPYKRILHLNLYKSKKLYSAESLSAGTIRKTVDHLFSCESCNEREHGIIENDEITLQTWKSGLSVFDARDVVIRSAKDLASSELFNPSNYMKYLVSSILGGSIGGTCRKAGHGVGPHKSMTEILICPSCRLEGNEARLIQEKIFFICGRCSKKYPLVDDIIFAFPPEKFEALYPEIFRSTLLP